jgi:ABC-type antimicrobial peptide transport system permease subunit
VIRVALKGMLGRKLRAVLTAIAIVLGVAMVSGTYVLTDTIQKGFDTIFTVSYKNADAVITGKTSFGSDQNGTIAPSFPEPLLAKVRSLPTVGVALGDVQSQQTRLVGRDGKVISVGGAPNLGFSVNPDSDQRFNPLTLVSGGWPSGPGEIAIDAATAKKKHYRVGESIGVQATGPVQQFRITGVAKFGSVSSIGGATFAIFDLPVAQRLFSKAGQLDSIRIAAKAGVSQDRLLASVRHVLPHNTQVRSGTSQAKQDASDVNDFLSILQKFLLAFGLVALFVGAFVIVNTLSITVAQRTREFATLRTLGATRRQVLGSVVVEGLVVGALASVIGLFLGLGLAKGLNALFVVAGIDLPKSGTVFAPRTIVFSLAIGILVTLVASIWPARRATKVPPVAAVREGFVLPPGWFARYGPFVAVAVGAVGVAGLVYGAFGHGIKTGPRLGILGVGVVLLFLGVALVASRVVRPVSVGVSPLATIAIVVLSIVVYPVALTYWFARYAFFGRGEPVALRLAGLVGSLLVPVTTLLALLMWLRASVTRFEPEWPVPLPSVLPDRNVNQLAERNARRNPQRTAAAAAALMIGLALVTFVAVLAAGLKSSFEGAVNDLFHADYALTSQNGFTPTETASADALRKLPGVTTVAGVRAGQGKAFGDEFPVTAVDPGISRTIILDWKEGSQATLERLGRRGAVVDDGFANDHDLHVESPVRMQTPYGRTIDLRIAGIFDPPKGGSPFGKITTSSKTFDAYYPQPKNVFAFVNIRGGETDANTAELKNALKSFPDAKIQTEGQFKKNQERGINVLLNLLFVLLGLSIVISLFGIVNTLVLTVYERTRELGMLRAVGMDRRQLRRMIRQEAAVTALIGAALGIPIGIFLALLIGRAIEFVAFAVPYVTLGVFVVAAIVAGLIAAIYPARRAARLNVLEALQYE